MDRVAQSLSLALLVCVFCVCAFFNQTHIAPLNMAFDGGTESLLLAVGDVPDVAHPHPSMREGAVVVVWWMQGPSKAGDVAMVRNGDMAWLVGIGVGNGHALT